MRTHTFRIWFLVNGLFFIKGQAANSRYARNSETLWFFNGSNFLALSNHGRKWGFFLQSCIHTGASRAKLAQQSVDITELLDLDNELIYPNSSSNVAVWRASICPGGKQTEDQVHEW